jgi:hypothetical protein
MSQTRMQCQTCQGVLPAGDRVQFTRDRAHLITQHGFCRCSTASSDTGTPSAATSATEPGPARQTSPAQQITGSHTTPVRAH